MKTTTSTLLRSLAPIAALLAGSPVIVPVLRAQSIDGAVADAKSAAIKALLQDLDEKIDRLDEFVENAPSEREKQAAKLRLEKLKERRNELRKNYAQARFESLKADVQAEYNKLVTWAKKTFSTSPEAKLDRAVESAAEKSREVADAAAKAAAEAKARTIATVNPAAVSASAEVAAYKINPSTENKEEAKAALATLDAEIKRLDDRCDNLPKGKERDAALLRLKALKERRSELASDFRKARFDALIDDVKAEWKKLTN